MEARMHAADEEPGDDTLVFGDQVLDELASVAESAELLAEACRADFLFPFPRRVRGASFCRTLSLGSN